MKKFLTLFTAITTLLITLQAHVEPAAGKWKPWFISSVKAHRLPAPSTIQNEIQEVITVQKNLDEAGKMNIIYWNAGAPGYRWQEFMSKLWMTDTGRYGALSNMLMNTAIYDATLVAWDTKYAFNMPRPFMADKRIMLYASKPESPSYPCEHSVAAGVAATIIGHYYPHLRDSVNKMAIQSMKSRIAAGTSFPRDTKAGYELGKKIAELEIKHTHDFISTKVWDGIVPDKKGLWSGKKPMAVTAKWNKTVILDSASQLRPPPPPDFEKEMAELKNYKQNFRSQANAWYYASQPIGDDLMTKKIFEYNLQSNPPRAARIYAAVAVAYYDAFIACFDAKYAYWGIRPDQYDTTYRSLVPTPPFPGYPSGHAVMSGVIGELFSYFFPLDRPLFQRKAKEGAESRFQAGIHFRSDNEVGLDMGKKIAEAVINRLNKDGAEQGRFFVSK